MIDFILDTASINLRSGELEAASRQIVASLVSRFDADMSRLLTIPPPWEIPISLPLVSAPVTRDEAVSDFKKFLVLTRRSFLNSFRQPGLFMNRIAQPVAIGVIMTLFFARLGSDYYSVQNRFGVLQETAPLVFAGMLNNIALYPIEVRVLQVKVS
jgi:hypothetical protein